MNDTQGAQQLLDVEDLYNSRHPEERPDERSVMTYVASFFHAFSSMGMLPGLYTLCVLILCIFLII